MRVLNCSSCATSWGSTLDQVFLRRKTGVPERPERMVMTPLRLLRSKQAAAMRIHFSTCRMRDFLLGKHTMLFCTHSAEELTRATSSLTCGADTRLLGRFQF